mmetsp:Transcript_10240/g.31285  ORF Transcript_10240/g.31285 Transcript_10240/m.31285 type:complete len:223 (+) Transcript_10240:305-973(+)
MDFQQRRRGDGIDDHSARVTFGVPDHLWHRTWNRGPHGKVPGRRLLHNPRRRTVGSATSLHRQRGIQTRRPASSPAWGCETVQMPKRVLGVGVCPRKYRFHASIWICRRRHLFTGLHLHVPYCPCHTEGNVEGACQGQGITANPARFSRCKHKTLACFAHVCFTSSCARKKGPQLKHSSFGGPAGVLPASYCHQSRTIATSLRMPSLCRMSAKLPERRDSIP